MTPADFLRRDVPALGKSVFRLGLSATFGLDEAGCREALERIDYVFWSPRMKHLTPALRTLRIDYLDVVQRCGRAEPRGFSLSGQAAEARQRPLHETRAHLLGRQERLRRRKAHDGVDGMVKEPAAQPGTHVEEELGEPVPLERHADRLLHRVGRNARPHGGSGHAQRPLVAGTGADAAPDAALLVEPGHERVLLLAGHAPLLHRDGSHRTGARATRAPRAAPIVPARQKPARVHRREAIGAHGVELSAAATAAIAR